MNYQPGDVLQHKAGKVGVLLEYDTFYWFLLESAIGGKESRNFDPCVTIIKNDYWCMARIITKAGNITNEQYREEFTKIGNINDFMLPILLALKGK